MVHKERVLIGKNDQGKPIYKWATGNSLDELHDAVVRIYVDTGLIDRFLVNGNIPPEKRQTFKEYTEVWLKTYKDVSLKPTTLDGYRTMLRAHFYPVFGKRIFCQITTKDLQDFLNARSYLSRKYLSDMVKFFGMIVRDAIEDGVVERDITASRKLTIPSNKKTVREALQMEDFLDVVDHLPDLNLKDRQFMALLMYTGLRRGEALGLRWEDIDQSRGVIHISRNVTYHTKTALVGTPKTENGYRDVPLVPHLLNILQPLQQTGYIIASTMKPSEPICHSTFVRTWKRINSTIDLHGATPHIFRHTYITILAGLNIDVKTLQAIAGHGDIQITMNRYVHKRTEGLVEAGELFEKQILCDRNVTDIEMPNILYSEDNNDLYDE